MAHNLHIPDAAKRLGVHPDTIKRRLERGQLRGRKEKTAQGFVWVVEIEDDDADREARGAREDLVRVAELALDALRAENADLRAMVRDLIAQRPQIPLPQPLPQSRGPREKKTLPAQFWRWLTKY